MEKQSLTLYHGGFLLNACFPLNLSLNVCSHSCPFCFSNLNEPDRKAYPRQALRMIRNRYWADTLEGHLLKNKYPVVFSNHVDPFAGSNLAYSLPLIKAMVKMGIPMSLQTKGGHGLLKPFKTYPAALDMLDGRPTVFYVSLETLDDGIGAISAPGAPRPTQRLEMIAEVISRGHRVCVGVNPVVPQWIPDPQAMVKTLAALGVEGIWVQALHLSHKQIAKMPDRDKAKLGPEILDQAIPRNHAKYPAIAETIAALRHYAAVEGIAAYDSQQGERSDYFTPYKETYPQRYPLMQDFVNWAWDTLADGDLIYYETWRDQVLPWLPEGVWPIGQHIGAVAGPRFWSAARHEGITNKMSYEQLLGYIWGYKESVYCPVNVACFAWAGDYEKQADGTMGWSQWLDSNQRPILVFTPESSELWSQQSL